jgi:hypothetical protein
MGETAVLPPFRNMAFKVTYINEDILNKTRLPLASMYKMGAENAERAELGNWQQKLLTTFTIPTSHFLVTVRIIEYVYCLLPIKKHPIGVDHKTCNNLVGHNYSRFWPVQA